LGSIDRFRPFRRFLVAGVHRQANLHGALEPDSVITLELAFEAASEQ